MTAPVLPDADGTPQIRTGRRPQVTFLDWHKSQTVMLGANGPHEWYWQCPKTGCRVWAGPYADVLAGKQDGMDHVYTAHDSPVAHRAPQVAKSTITAADVYQEALIAFETVGAEELGVTYEAMLAGKDPRKRKGQGTYYTPEPLAEAVSRFSLDLAASQLTGPSPHELLRIVAMDPACGSGLMLAAGARWLAMEYAARLTGGRPTAALAVAVMPTVVLSCMFGVDVDPVAAELARMALSIETVGAVSPQQLERHIICGDTLAGAWPPALADRGVAGPTREELMSA